MARTSVGMESRLRMSNTMLDAVGAESRPSAVRLARRVSGAANRRSVVACRLTPDHDSRALVRVPDHRAWRCRCLAALCASGIGGSARFMVGVPPSAWNSRAALPPRRFWSGRLRADTARRPSVPFVRRLDYGAPVAGSVLPLVVDAGFVAAPPNPPSAISSHRPECFSAACRELSSSPAH